MRSALFLSSVGLTLTNSALASPTTVVQQGRLLDSIGTPINGEDTLTISLSADSSGTSPTHTESFTVQFVDGYYAVVVGSDGLLEPEDIPPSGWVTVTIGTGAGATTLGAMPISGLVTSGGGTSGTPGDGTTAETAASSCLTLRDNGNNRGNTLYWLDPDGNGGLGAYEAYCDMHRNSRTFAAA